MKLPVSTFRYRSYRNDEALRKDPVVYSGTNQINVMVPFEIAGRSSTNLRVVAPVALPGISLPVAAAAPEIVSLSTSTFGYYDAAALNSNGALNMPANPAKPEEAVTVYVFGAGLFSPAFADGEIGGSKSGGSCPDAPDFLRFVARHSFVCGLGAFPGGGCNAGKHQASRAAGDFIGAISHC